MERHKKSAPLLGEARETPFDILSLHGKSTKQLLIPFPEHADGGSPHQLKIHFGVAPPRRAAAGGTGDFRLKDLSRRLAAINLDRIRKEVSQ